VVIPPPCPQNAQTFTPGRGGQPAGQRRRLAELPDLLDQQQPDALAYVVDVLAALQQALRAQRAVPPEFIEAGKNAFAWHNIDAELAQLTYDSTLDSSLELSLRAEAASIRALTFTSAHLTIELEVAQDSLLGQIIPAQPATIKIQPREDAEITLATDEIGCFSIQPIPAGQFRLHCRTAAGVDALTGWITL